MYAEKIKISLYVSLAASPNILNNTQLMANSRECFTAAFIRQASVPYNSIRRRLDLNKAVNTSSETIRPTFP